MANVSYLRTPGTQKGLRGARATTRITPGRRRRGPYLIGGALFIVVAVVAVGAIVLVSAKASLSADPVAMAKVGMPLGGGAITSVSVFASPDNHAVPVTVHDGVIDPAKLVPATTRLQVQVVVKRPGWIAWLAGKTQTLNLEVTAPAAHLRSPYVTVRNGPVKLHFRAPVSVYSAGTEAHHLTRHVLATPSTTISFPRTSTAGTVMLSAAPRTWESAKAVPISWFPSGGTGTAVASPAPGSRLKSTTPITLTFSKPVSKVLGSHLPPVSPTTSGTWHSVDSHTIQFRPEDYGYGLGATVKIPLPSGVRLVGATGTTGQWSVPPGSTTRLQQMLADLGYMPVTFHPAASDAALTPEAQEAAAVTPPKGRFSMRYPDTPGWLAADWQPGTFGEITKGAVMAFENQQGMAPDGVAGPQVWRALMTAVIHDQRYSFGYTVVDVSEGSPESETTWHNGRTVTSGVVNTGGASSPTATGTFAVFEHVPVTTMTGTNPDGSHYSDAGIPDVSYFNGGDALHGFIRASYGFPQSDGCVEMPYSEAAKVYPFTPIGTIVRVT